jgi:hypothetical protein
MGVENDNASLLGNDSLIELGKYIHTDSKIFYKWTTCLPARPIQPFWADFFALGSSNSEGACGISKYFFLDHFLAKMVISKV